MANGITPQEVKEVVESVINYLDIDLSEENLSPSGDMGRQDTIELLQNLVQKLNEVKTFSTGSIKHLAQKVSLGAKPIPEPVTSAGLKQVGTKPIPEAVTSAVLKQLSLSSPDRSIIDSIQSKLKVLLRLSIAELKQQAEYSGWLKKHKKQWNSKWNQRFCVLRDGILLYFESDKDMGKGKGYIVLGTYKFLVPSNSNGFTFELESCDKSTAYTFQADHKKEIDMWKQHIVKFTDQGFTKDQVNGINVMLKESRFSFSECPDDVEGRELADNNESIEGELYEDVATSHIPAPVQFPPPHVQFPPPCVPFTPPSAAVKIPPGGLALPRLPLQVQATPVHLPAQEEESYGDVAGPADEIYEDIPAFSNTSVNNVPVNNTPYIPPHVPTSVEQFSTSNLYIGSRNYVAAMGSQDLSFNCGDLMYILEKVDLNWWIAYHLNGKVGLVAKNFLKEAFPA